MQKLFTFLFSSTLLFSIIATSCTEAEKPNSSSYSENAELNFFIYDAMTTYYYWRDHLPVLEQRDQNNNLNTRFSSSISNYEAVPANSEFEKDPHDFLNSLIYEEKDRWSFLITKETYDRYYERGEDLSYGFGLAVDPNNHVRVTFAYDESPAGKAGLTRGDKLLTINGIDVHNAVISRNLDILNKALVAQSANMRFEKKRGYVVEVTLTKSTFKINAILAEEVFEINSNKVGYLAYNSFLTNSKDVIDAAFQRFKLAGVSDLILDMRYNGGGSLSVATHLGSLIIEAGSPNSLVFTKLQFNKLVSPELDETIYFEPKDGRSLGLTRLFVITTKSTASASEYIINALKPHINVFIIGSRTHGKPAGSIPFDASRRSSALNHVLFPIVFVGTNANGFYDYFNGFPVNASVTDDITRNFGDSLELCLNKALYYIENGSFGSDVARSSFEEEVIQLAPSSSKFRSMLGNW